MEFHNVALVVYPMRPRVCNRDVTAGKAGDYSGDAFVNFASMSWQQAAPIQCYRAGLAVVLALGLGALHPSLARADSGACRALEQRYDQIKTAASSIERNTLVFSAAPQDCVGLAQVLLKDGASLEARDRFGNMPLAIAAREGKLGLVNLFIDNKANVDARNLEGSTALFLAAENERVAAAKILLDHGADANLTGRSAIAPLGAAAYTGNSDLVAALLAKGAEPRAVDATGKSAILYAAGRAYTHVVKQLLDAGIDANARYGSDLTALMWAAGHSEEAGAADIVETIALLIARGAKLDEKDDRGWTALMIAADLGHAVAVEKLVAAGADKTITDKAGKTAQELAHDDATRTLLVSKL